MQYYGRSFLSAALFCATLVQAFAPSIRTSAFSATFLSSSVPSDVESVTNMYREALLDKAMMLKKEHGVLLVEKVAKEELKRAVEDLEGESGGKRAIPADYKDSFVGEWTLLCSTSTNIEGVDSETLPFLQLEPIRKIREQIKNNVNRYLTVRQVIKSTKDDSVIDRVDHVLEYDPPAKLQQLVDSLPQPLANLDINPLDVTASKVVLIHKASVEAEDPLIIKLGLQSIVLNVAGQSTNLDPDGKDVLGLNLPLGDFLNVGSFETTYMDDTLRVSRGKLGLVDQLRVFVRASQQEMTEALEEVIEGPHVGQGVQTEDEKDVDDITDPEFVEHVEEGVDNEEKDEDLGEANGTATDDPNEPRDSEEANSI